jgi:hypothetical protein
MPNYGAGGSYQPSQPYMSGNQQQSYGTSQLNTNITYSPNQYGNSQANPSNFFGQQDQNQPINPYAIQNQSQKTEPLGYADLAKQYTTAYNALKGKGKGDPIWSNPNPGQDQPMEPTDAQGRSIIIGYNEKPLAYQGMNALSGFSFDQAKKNYDDIFSSLSEFKKRGINVGDVIPSTSLEENVRRTLIGQKSPTYDVGYSQANYDQAKLAYENMYNSYKPTFGQQGTATFRG